MGYNKMSYRSRERSASTVDTRNGADSFSVNSKDLMGRAGVIRTKSGVFQTPHMFPVVDPRDQSHNRQSFRSFHISAIMTNAYLLKRSRSLEDPKDVHEILGFNQTVATDSGAYQILEYGNVTVRPEEIVRYQEEVNTDVGIILDVPTGYYTSAERARWSVQETLRRADEALRVRTRNDILWVGPIQGGTHLKEVARSASEMSKRDFAIYALGSPTEVMESQRFELLVDMILTAKKNVPPGKPFHLFGAGHPLLFAFLVAVGCDLFDSAAYALYARHGRYLTSEGTISLSDMEEFPCLCDVCCGTTPREVRRLDKQEIELMLAHHNLYSCFSELRKIREEMRRGRLWDLLELRAAAHPALRKCLRRISQHVQVLESHTPISKPQGIFYTGGTSDQRPEVVRYRSRVREISPSRSKSLLLLPGRSRRPYREDPRYMPLVKLALAMQVHIGFYSVPFGPVPIELDETYPIAQTESMDPEDPDLYKSRAELVGSFIRKMAPRLVLFAPEGEYGRRVASEISKGPLRGRVLTLRKRDLTSSGFARLIRNMRVA